MDSQRTARLPVAASLLILASMTLPARAADGCQPIFNALDKVMATPAHLHSTTTSGAAASKTRTSESIYSGGAIYVMIGGKWVRSPLTAAALLKQEAENRANGKVACQLVRDDSVNGEAAAVYAVRAETADAKSSGTVWISKSKGLPLRQDTDIDLGGADGKSHSSTRYEYTNVHAPDVK